MVEILLEEELISTWHQQIESACDKKSLEDIKVTILGKSGAITQALKNLGKLPPEHRREKGAELNAIRDQLSQAFQNKFEQLDKQEVETRLLKETVDITLPVYEDRMGLIHPLTRVKNEIKSFFSKYGFSFEEGPELEDEWHNFDALNIPSHHPARQNHDTFYIQNHKNHLLRTHTSTVQIRALEKQKPPVRLLSLGRVYRSDDLDATHTPMFHQVEGLVLEPGIHMGHLKSLIIDFCRSFFGVDDLPVRFRPSFFPFTEPSAEVDIGCTKKDGKLTLCKGNNWLELLGCGMVHPNVLRQCGIDPSTTQGFAFGMGIERLCMLKYGMTDIRYFYENEKHWLQHYGTRPR